MATSSSNKIARPCRKGTFSGIPSATPGTPATPSGLAATPAGIPETPSGLAATPSGLAATSSGLAGNPAQIPWRCDTSLSFAFRNLDVHWHAGAPEPPVLAVSIHFVGGSKTDWQFLRALVQQAGTSRSGVCDAKAAVWMKDGVYLPWKAPTTKHKVHGWTDYRKISSQQFRVVFHERLWSTVGRNSCWADTRVVSRDLPGSPLSVITGSPLAPAQAPEPKRARGPCLSLLLMEALSSEHARVALRERARCYSWLEEIGSGSFAKVYRALRHCNDGLTEIVAVKQHREMMDQYGRTLGTSMQEVYAHERCATHPNIVRVLDVCFRNDRVCVVLELHGRSLHDIAKTRKFVPAELRTIASHLLGALGYLHAEIGLVHGDLSEKNCLATDEFIVKLADLGCCSSINEDERPEYKAHVKQGNPLPMTTLPYRAPEVLLGCTAFGTSVDIWALGVMLLLFAGHAFTRRSATGNKKSDAAEALKAIFVQLGSPSEAILKELQGLPFWPASAPSCERQAHKRAVVDALRPEGVSFVDSCLSWQAASRPTASQALGSPFLTGCLQLVGGCGAHSGQRHQWNAVNGTVFQDVLEWLREDPGFELLGDIARDAVHSLHKLPTHVVRNNFPDAVKVTVGGYLTEGRTSHTMSTVSVDKPLVLGRFMQWRQALFAVNAAQVHNFQEELRAVLNNLGDVGPIGQSFIRDDVRKWMISVAEIHVTIRRSQASFEEPLHHDGAASVLHLGSTLWGRRTVAFKQEKVEAHTTKQPTPLVGPDIVVPCWPGHVYLGGVTGARHQVQHPRYDDADMWHCNGLGPCSVTIMCRCTVWPNRGRNMNQTPGPRPVFEAVTTCCRKFLATATLRLPTLAECQRQVVDARTPDC